MRIFLAGATGAIGRRLVPLLLQAGHRVTGTTRSQASARELERAGVTPAVLDVFDTQSVNAAMAAAKPEAVIHQLTDLPREFDEAKIQASYAANARIRTEGTRNLIAAALSARAKRFIVQSISFAYAPREVAKNSHISQERFPGVDAGKRLGSEPHLETDPLNLADPARAVTVKGAADMERQVLEAQGMEAIVLRYGLLYGPGTWSAAAARKPALHVDAAAQAAVLAVTRGAPGVYNIADDDGAVSITKARAELGFDPQFRL